MEYDSCIRANQSVEQYVRNGFSYLLVLRAAAVTITSKSRFWSVFLLGTKRINKMEYNGVKKHGNGNPMKYNHDFCYQLNNDLIHQLTLETSSHLEK